ncbi:MAG: hypothetical protein Q4F44_08720, partial [Bacteroidales bacterium]|nr:hypothetical protein [Bacteroidales bacterium]
RASALQAEGRRFESVNVHNAEPAQSAGYFFAVTASALRVDVNNIFERILNSFLILINFIATIGVCS